jgi:phospholipid/cholesterol/gamma-HCH transport system substrate-binding protein
MSARIRYQVLGVVLLLVVAGFLTVTIAAYRQDFTPIVPVTLDTDHIGNQLDTGADVKVRGLVVGEVRSIRSTGSGAVLDLALQPDKVGLIPANVSARLLPKTLFGERYVALQLPADPSGAHLAAGDVIPEDRSSASIEIDRVLGDLMPLLQAVQPQKLASTLDAMSTALAGRGLRLGDTLVSFGEYLAALNPSLPNVDADIADLASVADIANRAAPDLTHALSDLTTTSRTLVDQQANLRTLYATVTNASVDLTGFLSVNEGNLIDLSADSTPTLDVLARYAPEYPCLLKELVDSIPTEDHVFGKGTSHPDAGSFTVVVSASRGKYLPGVDTPNFTDDRGPRCYPETVPPNRFPQYPPGGPVQDGSTHPAPPHGTGTGNLQDLLPGSMTTPQSADPTGGVPLVANSPAEQSLIATLVAPGLGVLPADVPPWASVLVGPVFRGEAVTLK